MKLYQFQQLTEEQQMEVLRRRAVQVASRDEDFYQVRLYQIDGFYAETFHHTHFNVTARLNAFEDTDLLEPYFEAMDAAPLL